MKSKSTFAFELVTILMYTPITTQVIQRIKCLSKKDKSELFNKCKDYEIQVLKEIVTECLKECDKLLIKELLKPSGLHFRMSYLKNIVSSLYWFIGIYESSCEQPRQLEVQEKVDGVKALIKKDISELGKASMFKINLIDGGSYNAQSF